MKTTILFTLFSIFCCLSSFAQEEFSFKLYFEDAAGNKDTITIGYDESATNGIDTAFGEENIISQPWGSGLDARVGDKTYSGDYGDMNLTWLSENSYLSKKQILNYDCEIEEHTEQVSIQFYSENYPIIVKWDKSLLLTDECVKYSFISGGRGHFHMDVGQVGTYLYGFDSVIIKPYTFSSGVPEQLYVFTEYPEENNFRYSIGRYTEGSKNIGVLQFYFFRGSFVGLNGATSDINKLVFPNPIKNDEKLTVPMDGQFEIVSVEGRVIKSGKTSNKQIFLEELNSGNYILQITNGKDILKLKLTVM